MGYGAEIYLDGNYKPDIGNVEYYDITGVANYVNSFFKMIADSDRERVETMVRNLEVGKTVYTVFRMEYEEATKIDDEFFAEIKRIAEDRVFMKFYRTSKLPAKIDEQSLTIKKYQNLLSSEKNTYFDLKFDTKTIETYTINYGHVSLKDNMPFEEWKEKIISKDFITEDNINQFNKMCSEMEQGKNVYYVFDTGNYKNFLMEIKAKPVMVNAEKVAMVGTIAHIEKDSAIEEEKNSDIDDLTGLYRKNAIKKMEEDSINEAIREESDKILGIVMVDIDNFKTVNDSYGHQFGDKVIYAISSTLKDVVGDYGHCGRFGGDELCAFIDNVTSLDQLRGILRTLKTRVNNIKYEEFPSLKVTVSIGSASYPANGKSFDIIFKKADRALYIAKEKGRNRYVTYIDEIHGETLDEAGENTANTNTMTDKNEFTHFLSDISKFLYTNGKDGISEAIKMVHSAFALDRIQLYTLQGDVYKCMYKYGDYLDNTIETIDFVDDKFVELFKNDALVLNFVYNLEFTHPAAYKMLSDEGVFSAVLCLVKNKEGKIVGICSYEHLSYKKMFSQNELTIYTYLANMLGVIMG